MFRAGAAHRPFVGTRGMPRKQCLLTQPAAARRAFAGGTRRCLVSAAGSPCRSWACVTGRGRSSTRSNCNWSDRQDVPGRCSAPAVRRHARHAAQAVPPHPARRSAAGVRGHARQCLAGAAPRLPTAAWGLRATIVRIDGRLPERPCWSPVGLATGAGRNPRLAAMPRRRARPRRRAGAAGMARRPAGNLARIAPLRLIWLEIGPGEP